MRNMWHTMKDIINPCLKPSHTVNATFLLDVSVDVYSLLQIHIKNSHRKNFEWTPLSKKV